MVVSSASDSVLNGVSPPRARFLFFFFFVSVLCHPVCTIPCSMSKLICATQVEAKRAVPREHIQPRHANSNSQSSSRPSTSDRTSRGSGKKIFVGGLHYDTSDGGFLFCFCFAVAVLLGVIYISLHVSNDFPCPFFCTFCVSICVCITCRTILQQHSEIILLTSGK